MRVDIIKNENSTIYIHDDDCCVDMNVAVQEVTDIISDAYKRNVEKSRDNHQSLEYESPK